MKKVAINMSKAKEIHKDRIRSIRALKLQELDVLFQRELEKGSNGNVDSIVAKKQQLRDLPAHPDIESAQTPEELKLIWEETLLGPNPYFTFKVPSKKVRARNPDGTFIADDPLTPDVNEAWIDG